MFILYDLIIIFFILAYVPGLVLKKKWHGGYLERFGGSAQKCKEALGGSKTIWVHAVSVGEILAIAGLVQKLKSTFPNHKIVISTVTKTGYDLAVSKFKQGEIVIYAPVDLSWVVRRYVRAINPQIYIAAETEIWPNLFTCLAKNGVPIVQINGRISDKAFGRYQMIKSLLKPVLRCVTMFGMQTEADAQKIIELGADAHKVTVVGNLKFDEISAEARINSKDLGFQENSRVWIAGSTHPGEEKVILEIFKSLRVEFPDLRLIIAPRHIERTNEVVALIEQAGLRPVRFSNIKQSGAADAVIVVDTIGQLRSLYSLASVVFVGKSLPVTEGGGQNIIEPAFFAKPMIVGPLTRNFESVVNIFKTNQAVVEVKDAEGLKQALREILKDPQRAQTLGQAAREVVNKNQGATERTLGIINTVAKVGGGS